MLTLRRYDYVSSGKAVRVTVGQDITERTFRLHQKVICKRSEYFRNRCHYQAKDGTKLHVLLRTTSAGTFYRYVRSLYNVDDAFELEADKDHPAAFQLRRLLVLWNFGETIGDVLFKNKVMDSMVEVAYTDPKRVAVDMAEFGPICKPQSGPWRFAADFVARYAKVKVLRCPPTTWDKPFKAVVMTELLGLRVTTGGYAPSCIEAQERYREDLPQDGDDQSTDEEDSVSET